MEPRGPFDKVEKSDKPCPHCGGELQKITRPVNVQVFQCKNCCGEFGDQYFAGYKDCMDSKLMKMKHQVSLHDLNTGQEFIYPGDWAHLPRKDDILQLFDDTGKLEIEGRVHRLRWAIMEDAYTVFVEFWPA